MRKHTGIRAACNEHHGQQRSPLIPGLQVPARRCQNVEGHVDVNHKMGDRFAVPRCIGSMEAGVGHKMVVEWRDKRTRGAEDERLNGHR